VRIRILVAVAALTLVATVFAGPPGIANHRANQRANQRTGPCHADRVDGETIQHFMKRKISCAVETFGRVGGGAQRAICIAKRESGLIPTAESKTGMYLGLYQHAAKVWPKRYGAWTDPSWELSDNALNGRTNAIVTIRMVHALGGWKAAGWPVIDC
jgi:hypothetical protein